MLHFFPNGPYTRDLLRVFSDRDLRAEMALAQRAQEGATASKAPARG